MYYDYEDGSYYYEEGEYQGEAGDDNSINKILCSGNPAFDVLLMTLGLLTVSGVWGKKVGLLGLPSGVGYISLAIGGAGLAAKFPLKMCGDVDFWSKS